jgi:hypothetical protein
MTVPVGAGNGWHPGVSHAGDPLPGAAGVAGAEPGGEGGATVVVVVVELEVGMDPGGVAGGGSVHDAATIPATTNVGNHRLARIRPGPNVPAPVRGLLRGVGRRCVRT